MGEIKPRTAEYYVDMSHLYTEYLISESKFWNVTMMQMTIHLMYAEKWGTSLNGKKIIILKTISQFFQSSEIYKQIKLLTYFSNTM
jgi:hypothetical protein